MSNGFLGSSILLALVLVPTAQRPDDPPGARPTESRPAESRPAEGRSGEGRVPTDRGVASEGDPPAAEVLYSGPQKGEKTPSFKVLDVTGNRKEREFDPVAEAGDATALYFFFPVEVTRAVGRAMGVLGPLVSQATPLGLRTYYVGLGVDRLQGDQRLRDVWTSLKPPVPALLSADGIEGPGNWGLNRKSAVTLVLAKEGKVVFNYTALSPADSDYESIRAAMSKLVGKELVAPRPQGRGGMERGGRGEEARPPGREGAGAGARGDAPPAARPSPKPVDRPATRPSGVRPPADGSKPVDRRGG